MSSNYSLAELRGRGVEVDAQEAVAIVQQLMHDPHVDDGPTAAPGPPSLENVRVEADGSVCWPVDARPAIFELAVLLQALLPPGTPRVPGGLRYVIARGLLDVDAPPFDSVDDFSRALARFEQGDPREVVRNLVERAAHAPGVARPSPRLVHLRDARAGEGLAAGTCAASPSPPDRRSPSVTVSELRRQLREADARLFAQRQAVTRPRALFGFGRRVPAVAAGLAIGLSLIGVGQAMQVKRKQAPAQSVESTTVPVAAEPASLSPPEPVATIGVQAPTPTPAPAHRAVVKRARRRSAKVARVDVAPASAASPRPRAGRAKDTDSSGLFGHIRIKWVDDAFPRRP